MRIVLLVLVVAAVTLLAFPSSPTSPVAPGLAFAAEVSPMVPVGIDSACDLYCNTDPNGIKHCGTTPSGQNGCESIVNNNCIFTLCPPPGGCNPPCPPGPKQIDP